MAPTAIGHDQIPDHPAILMMYYILYYIQSWPKGTENGSLLKLVTSGMLMC